MRRPPCRRPVSYPPMSPSWSPFGPPSHPPHPCAPISTHLPRSPWPPQPCSRIPGPLRREIIVRDLHPGFSGRERWDREFRGAANPPFSSLGPPPPVARSLFAKGRAGSESRGLLCPECAARRGRPSQLVRSPGGAEGAPPACRARNPSPAAVQSSWYPHCLVVSAHRTLNLKC